MTDRPEFFPHADSTSAGVPAAMPGWHIFADLTPPELMIARRTRTVRIWVAIALALVVVGVGVVYDHARGNANDAAAAVIAEQDAVQALRSQQQQFANVTTLQATVDRAHQELAAVMTSDVNVDALIGKIWAALPKNMTINQIAVTVPDQTSGTAAASPRDSAGIASLDTSDDAHIGTVTLTGTGTTIDDLPAFIDKLSRVKGVYSPYPTSNEQSDAGSTSYSLQFTLTEALLTNLYATKGDN